MTEWDFGKPVSDNIILVNQLMRKFKLLLRRKGFLSQVANVCTYRRENKLKRLLRIGVSFKEKDKAAITVKSNILFLR